MMPGRSEFQPLSNDCGMQVTVERAARLFVGGSAL